MPARPSTGLALCLSLGFFWTGAPSLHAQETASDTLLTVQHYLNWEQVTDPQIAPDGSRIVYTRRWINRLEVPGRSDRACGQVGIEDLDGNLKVVFDVVGEVPGGHAVSPKHLRSMRQW